jgi:hypothetical protein
MSDDVRENRLRRRAAARGYRVQKSRRRDPLAVGFGRYAVYDLLADGTLVAGGINTLDALTLDEVEAFLNEARRNVQAERPGGRCPVEPRPEEEWTEEERRHARGGRSPNEPEEDL